jgi:hemolysin activation/secretion protein
MTGFQLPRLSCTRSCDRDHCIRLPISLLFAGFLMAGEFAHGQSLSLPLKRPSDEQLQLPGFEPEERPEPLQLPELPAPAPGPELSQQLRVYVRDFRITGNRVIPTKTLDTITAPYENRDITSGELQAVRHALTLYYINQGYINSGAVIPDQQVTNGVIDIHIVEGELTAIDVSGNERLRSGYISKRIELGAGPPLNIVKLGERLQILQQNPLIKRINAALAPGARPGESRLDVAVTEARPYELIVGYDNHQPPSVGGNEARIHGFHRDLTGFGDTLGFEYDRGEGLDEWSINYALPVDRHDTTLALYYDRIDSDVVSDPFDVLDIKGREETWSLSIARPFHLSVNRTFTPGLSLDLRQNKTYLLGEPFAFTTGTDNGRINLSVVRFSQEWLDRGRNQVLAARSLLSAGIDAFGATVNGEPRDGKFIAWLGQFQWARRIPDSDSQFIFRASAQAANGGLPSIEQYAIGGFDTVRGYRENRLIGDAGLNVSMEVRIPVYSSASGKFLLQLAPFIDYGQVKERSGENISPDNIGSAGVGLLGSFFGRIDMNIYYGYPFRKFDDPNDDLQDKGIFFSLSTKIL